MHIVPGITTLLRKMALATLPGGLPGGFDPCRGSSSGGVVVAGGVEFPHNLAGGALSVLGELALPCAVSR